MPVNFNDALAAYSRVARQQTLPGMEPRAAPKADFAGMLEDAAKNVAETLHESERQSIRAAAGTADINEVVAAVSRAEITLQTVVAVRDKVLQAYQEILRMPI